MPDIIEKTKEAVQDAKAKVFGESKEDHAAREIKKGADRAAEAITDARQDLGDKIKGNK